MQYCWLLTIVDNFAPCSCNKIACYNSKYQYGNIDCNYPSSSRWGQLPSIYTTITLNNHDLGNIIFVFRNFPLTQIHPYAQHAAETAESAAAQNKFWEMHDYLYEHQQALDDNHSLSLIRMAVANKFIFISG
jgi:hypothetical protein